MMHGTSVLVAVPSAVHVEVLVSDVVELAPVAVAAALLEKGFTTWLAQQGTTVSHCTNHIDEAVQQ